MRLARFVPVVALLLIGAAQAQDDKTEKPPEKKPGFMGIQTEGVAVEGSPAKTALRVLGLVPGSPAVDAGVKTGDLILALDGEAFEGIQPAEAPVKFRDRVMTHSAGERVRLLLRRDQLTVDTHVAGVGTGAPSVASGSTWSAAIPNVKKLIEENPGKVVTITAERATWEREIPLVLAERPGARTVALPANASLRPDLEGIALEPIAAFGQRLTERLGLVPSIHDLTQRLEQDENTEDAFRLRTVRYLKRDPWRLPQATKALARALLPAARGDLAYVASIAAFHTDADSAPILTTVAPEAPPEGSTIATHVEYCLALMRRARDLVGVALAQLTPDEKAALERDLPTLADKFHEGIYLHEDEDPARWKRHSDAIDLLAKVDRAALLQGLSELAPLARADYLDRLAHDVRAEEAVRRGFFNESGEDVNGWLLYQEETELGKVVVGGSGTNGYRGDAVLIIDAGGDDRYYRRCGGASGLKRPVAVCLDLDGDDAYQATDPFAQGAAFMGVGLLVDRRGNDRYTTMAPFAQGAALCGAAALVDLAGDDVYRADVYSQGALLAQGGAFLLDAAGSDEHEAGFCSQGFAGPGGLGALVDEGGRDHYVALGRKKCSYNEDGVYDGFSQGASCGFRWKASGGIAALVHSGGSSVFEAGNFSQGCGYYYGWGLLASLGSGDDRYEGSRYAQAAAAHSAIGSLWDDGGDDRYGAWVAAAQSLAWDLCVTAFLDEGGNDRYDGGYNLSLAGSAHNGFALFYDASGEDSYRVHRKLPALAGPNDYHGGTSLSLFLDAGGQPNVYDVRDDVAFVPSRGVAVSGEKSVFADVQAPLEGMDRAKVEELLNGGARK